jgi:hypothetical protein
MTPCFAQQADGGYTGGATGGGVFSIPNFESDRRNSDLYVYLHPSGHPEWDDYRNLVKQIANQSIGAVPQPHFPEHGSNAGYMSALMYTSPGGTDGQGGTADQQLNNNNNGQTASAASTNTGNQSGGGVSTSVSGVVTNPPNVMSQPAPGLVE